MELAGIRKKSEKNAFIANASLEDMGQTDGAQRFWFDIFSTYPVFSMDSDRRSLDEPAPYGLLLMTAIYRPLEYRAVSAAGTVGETHARLMRRANLARNLTIPRTTGMPHRPSSSDGQSSVFVFSNPIGLRYRLAEDCPSLR